MEASGSDKLSMYKSSRFGTVTPNMLNPNYRLPFLHLFQRGRHLIDRKREVVEVAISTGKRQQLEDTLDVFKGYNLTVEDSLTGNKVTFCVTRGCTRPPDFFSLHCRLCAVSQNVGKRSAEKDPAEREEESAEGGYPMPLEVVIEEKEEELEFEQNSLTKLPEPRKMAAVAGELPGPSHKTGKVISDADNFKSPPPFVSSDESLQSNDHAGGNMAAIFDELLQEIKADEAKALANCNDPKPRGSVSECAGDDEPSIYPLTGNISPIRRPSLKKQETVSFKGTDRGQVFEQVVASDKAFPVELSPSSGQQPMGNSNQLTGPQALLESVEISDANFGNRMEVSSADDDSESDSSQNIDDKLELLDELEEYMDDL